MTMRTSIPTRCLVMALALAACATASANWFSKGQPVPDWGMEAYKIKTPDYASDASAVILYDEYVETIDAQGRATEREREAIRILKPQGRGNTCAVSYDVDEKINYFRAWTIAADEKTYQAQDTDFVEEGDTDIPIMLSARKERVAHPPALDVGATIVCESEELMKPYIQEKVWSFQNGIPVVDQALEIDLPPGRQYFDSWHRHDAAKPTEMAPNHWRWELKDTPALILRDIPSAPDWTAMAQRMSVQWGSAAVEGRDNEWRAIGNWVTMLEAGRPDPSPEITAKVQQLIAGAPDFYTRVSRITESIQNDIRYFVVSRGISGLQANHAADIFRNRYGDCKDKTTLLISMLQVAGIHAFYVPVDSERGFVDPNDPSIAGNHMITAIELPADVNDPRLQAIVKTSDGKRYLIFDPTNPYVPIGDMPDYEQGGYGLLLAGKDSQVIEFPVLNPALSAMERTAKFELAGDGTLKGDVSVTRSGGAAWQMRGRMTLSSDKEQREFLEKILQQDFSAFTLNTETLNNLKQVDQPLGMQFSVTAPSYARTAGALLLVRPRVLGSDADPLDDKPRKVPVSFPRVGTWTDNFDVKIPAGYTVDDVPDPVNLDVGFATYHSEVKAQGDTLHYTRQYVLKKVELTPDQYGALRKLEGQITSDENSNAVLKKQ